MWSYYRSFPHARVSLLPLDICPPIKPPKIDGWLAMCQIRSLGSKDKWQTWRQTIYSIDTEFCVQLNEEAAKVHYKQKNEAGGYCGMWKLKAHIIYIHGYDCLYNNHVSPFIKKNNHVSPLASQTNLTNHIQPRSTSHKAGPLKFYGIQIFHKLP